MFDKAPAVELITEVLVEGVRIRAMVAAGDLDTEAAVRPGKLLGGGHQQTTDASPSKVGSDDEARDATERASGVKQRDAMHGDNAGHPPVGLGHENGGAG